VIEKTQKAEGLRRIAYELWEQGRLDNKGLGQRLEDIKRRYSLTPAEQDIWDALKRKRKTK
jgi:hypothetical protein